jgi:hypothetical protein
MLSFCHLSPSSLTEIYTWVFKYKSLQNISKKKIKKKEVRNCRSHLIWPRGCPYRACQGLARAPQWPNGNGSATTPIPAIWGWLDHPLGQMGVAFCPQIAYAVVLATSKSFFFLFYIKKNWFISFLGVICEHLSLKTKGHGSILVKKNIFE